MPCLRRALPEQQHDQRRQIGGGGDVERPADQERDVQFLETRSQHIAITPTTTPPTCRRRLWRGRSCRCLRKFVHQIVRHRAAGGDDQAADRAQHRGERDRGDDRERQFAEGLASSGAAMLLSVGSRCRWSSRPGPGKASARRRTRCWRCRRRCSCAAAAGLSRCNSESECAAASGARRRGPASAR